MVELKKQNFKQNKQIYRDYKKKIAEVLGEKSFIKHVGSTAIPNMYGKNIIDILIGAENEIKMNEISNILKNMGFYPGKNSTGMIYRFFANREEETKSGDIHIHLVLISSDRYKDFILLKKYLLKNKLEAKNYSEYKKDLIKDGHFDRENYKKLKSNYVSSLLERAIKELSR